MQIVAIDKFCLDFPCYRRANRGFAAAGDAHQDDAFSRHKFDLYLRMRILLGYLVPDLIMLPVS
ncbi:hypothetical protein D3C78_1751910 [compost metagenome]